MRVVLATRNAHKVEEVRRILAPYDVELVSLSEFPDVADVVGVVGVMVVLIARQGYVLDATR